MRRLRFALYLLPALALGCRTDPNTALLERDLRLQEDKIWQLESMLDDSRAAREATIRENEALKKELTTGERGPGGDFRAPAVEMPGQRSTPRRQPRGEAPKLEAPSIEMPDAGGTGPVEIIPGDGQAAAVEGRPTRLVFNKRLTGGLDRDGRPGDEGILVAVEPRDAAGNLVKATGKISVVVLDPSQDGEAARVARWDFAADELPSHFHNTGFARGLQFDLPWPSSPPVGRELQLFVRFTSPEGDKITADTKIDIRPPSPGALDRDRQTKSWSSTQSASRDPRRRNSRLEMAPPAGSDRSNRAKDEESTDEPRDDRQRETAPQQAQRPAWKPYR